MPGNVEVYVGTDDESEDVCEDQASIRKSKHAKIESTKGNTQMEKICNKADCTHN